MKRIIMIACMVALCVNHAYAMDQKPIELMMKEAKLFGTIKNLYDSCEADGPILLKNIDNRTLHKLVKDLPWALNVHAKYTQSDIDQILKMSDKERIQRAIRATKQLIIPDYSAQTLHNNIRNLRGAHYLEALELAEAYAKIVAMLSVSDESLRALHEQSTDHPILEMPTTLSDGMRNAIYRYIPQIWGERLKIECDDGFWSLGFSPDSSMVVTGTKRALEYLVQIRDVKTGDVIREIRNGIDP